jgi:hypothetical protein
LGDPHIAPRGSWHLSCLATYTHDNVQVRSVPWRRPLAPSRKPEWQLFWIVQHGVRYSGMGAWRHLMPDLTIWQVVGFLSRLDSLPPAVDAAWRAGGR